MLEIIKFMGRHNVLPNEEITVYKAKGNSIFASVYLQEAKDVDINDAWKLSRRKGRTKVYSGAVHSINGNGSICLFREGSALKRLNKQDYSVTTLRNDLRDLVIPMAYLDVAGKIYYSDGQHNGVVENKVSRSWGLQVPIEPKLSLINSGGHLREGKYQVAITFVRQDGQESGSSIPLGISAGENQGIRVYDIPVSDDSTVTHINIYMTAPNGEVLLEAVHIANGTLSHDLLDDSINYNLQLLTQDMYPPPAGEILEWHYSRIYVVMGNLVWFSQPYGYELFRLADDYIPFEDCITMWLPVDEGIWVATPNKVIFMAGKEPPFLRIEKGDFGVPKGTGIKVEGSLITIGDTTLSGNTAIFVSNRGLCVGTSQSTLILPTEEVFSFKTALEGTSLFRRHKGMSQMIVGLRDASATQENDYTPYVNEVKIKTPKYRLSATT